MHFFGLRNTKGRKVAEALLSLKDFFCLVFNLEDQLEEIFEHAQKALVTISEFTKLVGQ